MAFITAEIIKKKRSGQALESAEIEHMVKGYAEGSLPDYQMAAWLMAVLFRDMTEEETWALTRTMMDSGRVLDFSHLGFAVDKHSTGGVGDKTSLVLGPIVAAQKIPVPMIAGRGLGHTGGTIDKLEAIPGFSCDLGLQNFVRQVETFGFCLIGQTGEICPADKKIYGLRDVTATVESYPLICASIMSKKIAEGIQGLVLDVKSGSGAFMKDEAQAKMLAERLCRIGELGGKKVSAAITDMNQPLGRMIGNSIEIEEVVAILKQEPCRDFKLADFADCEELSLRLAGMMFCVAGRTRDFESGYQLARETLESGAAYSVFEEFVRLQRGRLEAMPKSQVRGEVKADRAGVIASFETEQIGYASVELGAGRLKTSDVIHPLVGLDVLVRIGDVVEKGQPLFRIYGAQSDPSDYQIRSATARLIRATKIVDKSGDLTLNQSVVKRPAGTIIETVGWRPA